MTNLGIPAAEWLEDQFRFEYCAECGRDAEGHDAIPFMGNWFARCKSVEDGDPEPPSLVPDEEYFPEDDPRHTPEVYDEWSRR